MDSSPTLGARVEKEPVTIGPDATVAAAAELMLSRGIHHLPDATVAAAAELMLSRGIHHLPVAEGDRLVGIVDIADTCRAFLGQVA